MADLLTPHPTRADLDARYAALAPAPRERGTVEMIVVRPGEGARQTPGRVTLSAALGLAGDHWSLGCWRSLPDGRPDPDVQVCLMQSRILGLIAGPRENWPPAGDNLILDFDLTPESVPAGTRLGVGTAVIEITAVPHKGCAKFVERYGREACAWVNVGEGGRLHHRGVYARVVRDGTVSLADPVARVPS